ncbi:hypothetical protein L5515_006232 [Caenorhabditis briggsae]|uniref:Uncharacterized protein n=1 Tax=Caenorhabditis briggsae TaxID=6238 RepID=A0AAE9JHW9_CAEBR|nr:hypothetical protein L5515_006232 [Caenorhabditis briggsae]
MKSNYLPLVLTRSNSSSWEHKTSRHNIWNGALQLDKSLLDQPDEIRKAIQTVIGDSNYKKNARRQSSGRSVKQTERCCIEALRRQFGPLETSDSEGRHLNTSAYYSLDIALAVIVALLILLFVINFVFKCVSSQDMATILFKGWKMAIWVSYSMLFGALWIFLCFFCGKFDEYSMDYTSDEMSNVYSMNINKTAGMIIVAYSLSTQQIVTSLEFFNPMIFDETLQIRFYYFTGIVCVLNNTLAIYLLIFKSGNVGTYRNYMLYFQIICFLLDTHLTLLVSPIVYFPALLGVSHGFYSKILSIRTHYQINIIFTLIVLQITSLLCSFIKKHQSVAAIDQKRIMGTFQKYLIKVLLHIPPLLISVSFGFSNLDKAEEIEIAKAEYPKLVHLLSLPNAELYSTSSVSIKITLVIMIGTFVLFCSLFLFYYIQILQMLHDHRQFMAARTYSKHFSAVLSLVAQLTVLVIWLAIPLAVLLGDVILHIEGFEAFCNLLICLFSTHSIMSTIVMVFTFPAFRRVVSCREK